MWQIALSIGSWTSGGNSWIISVHSDDNNTKIYVVLKFFTQTEQKTGTKSIPMKLVNFTIPSQLNSLKQLIFIMLQIFYCRYNKKRVLKR